jgi:hypothetical protein
MDDQKLTVTKRWLKNRRSQRIELNVSVVVYRAPSQGPVFCESTQTLVVNAHGALVTLRDLVVPSQRLFMQNVGSGEQLECRVVSVKKAPIGPPQVALEFTRPTPSFWHIAFTPADWKPNA